MKFTLSWLREYVEFNLSPEELAEKLTMAGLEVESIEHRGKGLEDVVIVRILDMKPHPNASKLTLCDVTDGTKQYKIVCGATNMKAGDTVALAVIGAKLPKTAKFPDGIEIKAAKIRGEVSEGMLCAENELGLSEESPGIMILPQSAPIGTKLMDYLGLNEVILEVGITPNRSDCLSVLGIAREVAAILGTELKYPDFSVSEGEENMSNLAGVEVLDSEGCPRYSCRVIKDVKIAPSPEWLKACLESSGIRSINNVVDVTNFILLELGQPLHAFDYDLIENRKIIVRSASEGEVVRTLDGVDRKLTTDDLLICDGGKPVALAGVMGGGNTEVSQGTKNILLESAYFNPIRVRRTSKKTTLRSESSYRFERGVDPNGVVRALDRASELMRGLAGGKVAKGRIDVYPSPIKPLEVKLSLKRLNSILGTGIETEKVKEIAAGLQLELLEANDGVMLFRVPTFRVDLTREIDLIEEIARQYGYNKIPTTLPSIRMKAETLKREKVLEAGAKDIFLSLGFIEAINYSFEDPETLTLFNDTLPLGVLNPISKEASVMRTNLLSGMVRNVVTNLNRQVQDVKIFETGKVFMPKESGLPEEIRKIAAAATGSAESELWEKEEIDFFYLKGVLQCLLEAFAISDKIRFEEAANVRFLHPGKSARIIIGNEEAGVIGELNPDFGEKFGISKKVYLFEIDLDKLAGFPKHARKKFSPLPKFPSVRRDIALIVKESLTVGEILREVKKVDSTLIEDANVFDVFKGASVGEGKKSVAISLIIRAADRTLTDEETNKVQTNVLNKLQSSLGAELRK